MLPKAHSTSHSRMSGSRWMITPSWLSGTLRSFLYISSVYSCHLFLISSASVKSVPFLSYIMPIFAWNIPLVSLIFLKWPLVFPILLLSSISLHWSLRKAFLSLPVILWNTAFRQIYLSFSPLPLASLLFSAIFKTYSENHFAFLHFSFLEDVWSYLSVQCYEPPSIVLQAVLSIRPNPWICHVHCKWLDLGHTWMVVVFPTFFNLSLKFAIRSSWSELQSAPSLVFADCIELLHLWLQRI